MIAIEEIPVRALRLFVRTTLPRPSTPPRSQTNRHIIWEVEAGVVRNSRIWLGFHSSQTRAWRRRGYTTWHRAATELFLTREDAERVAFALMSAMAAYDEAVSSGM